jgi:hypothetical protein
MNKVKKDKRGHFGHNTIMGTCLKGREKRIYLGFTKILSVRKGVDYS